MNDVMYASPDVENQRRWVQFQRHRVDLAETAAKKLGSFMIEERE